MRIIMKTGLAGNGFAYRSGQEVDLDHTTARRLIARGLAVPVRQPEIERAVEPTPETTAAKLAAARRRRTPKAEKDS